MTAESLWGFLVVSGGGGGGSGGRKRGVEMPMLNDRASIDVFAVLNKRLSSTASAR